MNSHSKIHLLPEHIIDQIKAGEVIERPSTLLKEILENSLDAKSSQIDVHIVNNGLDLITLIDNGIGIIAEDLPLAFCRHATSKISQFEDIYHLNSYGFRGEALASIASISKITCESQTDHAHGLIKIEGGETKTHQTDQIVSSNTGTKLFIKELFYNTPVRMKFIQSKTSERNQLKKILYSFLLLNPQTAFSIKWDDEEKQFFEAYSKEDRQKRIQDVIGKKQKLDFFVNENIYDGVHFEIYLSKDSNRGNAHKNHYLFINNRYVQDIQLHKIILNSASNLWPEGETGHYIAFIRVPSDEIDVNIHPNKTVVKLFRAPKVYSMVSSTIKQIESKYSLKEQKSYSLGSSEQSFNLDSTRPDYAVDYKTHDFKSSQDLNSYFDNLHTSHEANENLQESAQNPILKHFQFFDLIQLEGSIYILNKKLLSKLHVQSLFELDPNQQEIVPLMVSRPIPMTENYNIKNLAFFERYGFELDQIDSRTILLRSFPKLFQHYPYLSMLEENLNLKDNIQTMKDIHFNFLNQYEFTKDFLLQVIAYFGKVSLLEERILKLINEQDIQKIYESK